MDQSLILSWLWVFFVGFLACLQQGFNVSIAVVLGNATYGALVSMLVAMLVLLGICVYRATYGATRGAKRDMPKWWECTGGIAAAIYVAMGPVLIPRLGFALWAICVVSGQISCGVILDHVGFLGALHSVTHSVLCDAVSCRCPQTSPLTA
jgi:bacterial/archaeal transporter family-2 protein